MKQKLNLLIDAIMLIVLMMIAGIGFLIKYILLPGYKRSGIYDGDTELYFMGLTRHQWGSIHLYISFFLLILLALHIILHWGMIVCIFKKMVIEKKLRIGIALLLGFVCVFFAFGPFLIKPQVVPLERNHLHKSSIEGHKAQMNRVVSDNELIRQDTTSSVSHTVTLQKKTGAVENHEINNVEVFGYQTLQYVANQYNADVYKIAAEFNIPEHLVNEKLGRLKKIYPFTMDDIRNSILKNKK